MATSLRNLTRVGTDLRQVAALLRSKGRHGDTVLAHINPQEAALLKARGGAGTLNPETGLPEFYEYGGDYEQPSADEFDYSQYGAMPEDMAPQGGEMPDFSPSPEISDTQGFPVDTSVSQPMLEFQAPAVSEPTPSFRPSQNYGPGMTGAETSAFDAGLQRGAPAPSAPAAGGMSEEMKKRLGLAGIQALGTGMLAGRAVQQQRAAAQQIGQIGAPYRAKGAELMGLAQQGQLTATGQRQLDALRAQMAQRASQRGGVGANQIAQQAEAFRQQLLQQQYDLGLKLSGISDQYALQAIKAGMSADQAVNQMLGSAMTNIGRIFAGQPAPQTPTPPGGG